MTVSAYDCTGCGSCANVCPGKKGEKALVMKNMEENAGKQEFLRLRKRDSCKTRSSCKIQRDYSKRKPVQTTTF